MSVRRPLQPVEAAPPRVAGLEASFTKLNVQPREAPTNKWPEGFVVDLEVYERLDANDATIDDMEYMLAKWQEALEAAQEADEDDQVKFAKTKLKKWQKKLDEANAPKKGTSRFQNMKTIYKREKKQRDRVIQGYAAMLVEEHAETHDGAPLRGAIYTDLSIGEMATLSRSADFATKYPKAAAHLAATPELNGVLFPGEQ